MIRWPLLIPSLLVVAVAPALSLLKTLGLASQQIWLLEQGLGGDKVVHFSFGFALMLAMLLALFSLLRDELRLRFKPYLWLGIGVLVAFFIDECLQAWSPLRQFDLLDFAMSALGGGFAWLLFQLARQIWLEKVDL
ncbi:hypothetical protein [Motilimonas eburnea]|uniref:hypothetical protein n=1 Tax=Motilimonas eburnea TaxID=1737488 RepID=UPI001E41FF23|nr:hypothetical protein [Motilimonas eburnea]MCE2570629.1 hypothetical protein [Motilimonas eburnea]